MLAERRPLALPFLCSSLNGESGSRAYPRSYQKMTRLAKWEAAYLTTWQVPHMEASTLLNGSDTFERLNGRT